MEPTELTVNVHVWMHAPEESEILKQLGALREKVDKIMAGVSDVTAAELQESTDLKTLHTLVGQLLTAVANGNLSSAQAQTLVTQMSGDDTTVQADIAAIQAAVAPATPPAPPTPPASS